MLTIVRGSYFTMGGRFLFDTLPVNASGWGTPIVILSTYDGSEIFEQLNFEWFDSLTGQARVWADDTTNWPVGRARIDAQIIDQYGNPYNAVCDYLRIIDSMINKMPKGDPTEPETPARNPSEATQWANLPSK